MINASTMFSNNAELSILSFLQVQSISRADSVVCNGMKANFYSFAFIRMNQSCLKVLIV